MHTECVCMWNHSVLFTFLPAQDLVYSAPKLLGFTLGMIFQLTSLHCLALVQEPYSWKLQSPCVPSSAAPSEISPGLWRTVSWRRESLHLIPPTKNRVEEESLLTRALRCSPLSMFSSCCHKSSLCFSLTFVRSSWKIGTKTLISSHSKNEVRVTYSDQLIKAGIFVTMHFVALGETWTSQRADNLH